MSICTFFNKKTPLYAAGLGSKQSKPADSLEHPCSPPVHFCSLFKDPLLPP